MGGQSNTTVIPPEDWGEFERCIRVLFQCILEDPNVKFNGTQGQGQGGVDSYGTRKSTGGLVGIQCKQKKAGKKVTEGELRDEVKKSDDFAPALSELIIVTTVADDAHIDTVARKITEERKIAGKPLLVSVWGWGTLQSEILKYPASIDAFQPDRNAYSKQIISDLGEIKTAQDSHLEQILSAVNALKVSPASPSQNYETHESEAVEKLLHAQIDGHRDLLRAGKPSTALSLLESCKVSCWETASDKVKFRLTTNIASAYADLGNESKAAELFIEASQYQPDNKLGQANLALAHLLKGESDQARTVAENALKLNPDNPDAASYLIQSLVPDKAIIEPLTFVQEALHTNPIVIGGLLHFYRARGDVRWHALAQEYYQQFPDNEHLERAAADAAMDSVFSANGTLLGELPKQEVDLEAVRNAANTLQKLWDKERASERAKEDTSLPYNLVQIYRLLEEKTSAEKVLDEAIAIHSKAIDLPKLKAIFLLQKGQESDALKILEKIPDDREAILIRSEIKLRSEPDAVIEELKIFSKKPESKLYQSQIIELIADAYLVKKDYEQALDVAIEHLKQNAADVGAYLTLVNVQRSTGNGALVLPTLDKAKTLVADDTAFSLRLLLAKQYEEANQLNEVINLLQSRVDPSHDSPALIMLFSALINSDRRKEANNLLKSMATGVADKADYLRAEIMLHLRSGAYTDAKNAANKYLSAQPNSLSGFLYWIEVNHRLAEHDEVRDALKTDFKTLKGSPKEFIRLARLLDRYGYHEMAFSLAYDKLLEHHDSPDVQHGFIGLFMVSGAAQNINLERSEVGLDTAFFTEDKHGRRDVYIIEPNAKLRIASFIVSPESNLATRAMGLKAGDRFRISDADTAEELTIKEIKHKYVYALHEAMERFEKLFPNHNGLKRVVIDDSKEQPLDEMLEMIKARHDHNKLVLDSYRDNPLPLEVFSEGLGTDIIATWSGLSEYGYKFKAAIGNDPEREAASKSIDANSQKGCVVDALTLHLIKRLKIEHAIASICGQIHTTESAKDVFRRRYEQVLAHGDKPYMTVYWQNGQYYRQEIAKEHIQNARIEAKDTLDWINALPVVKAESDYSFSDEVIRIKECISLGFLDPILAAKDSERMLLCEDLTYRQFAVREAQLNASWLQPVLMKALATGVLSQSEYSEAICQLIFAGHSFISIDAQILQHAAIETEYGVEKFKIVASTLFGHDAEAASHFRVMLGFLRQIWDGKSTTLHNKQITSILLNRFFLGEWHKHENYTSFNGSKKLEALSETLGREDLEFWNYTVGWLTGHFLISRENPKVKKNKKLNKR